MTTDKKILDACCGGRMMWFDKADPDAIYMDIREEEFIACDGRRVRVHPDLIADFRNMPFEDESFKLVVFDPPHFNRLGANSYTAQKYGRLFPSWETDLKRGFDECMRVLEPFGILIFKWNEVQIPVSKLLEIFGQRPLFGHKSGKASKTHWMCFMKR
jgi:ubiquinone/menaquinone biosynthesis C-methylase UbiE